MGLLGALLVVTAYAMATGKMLLAVIAVAGLIIVRLIAFRRPEQDDQQETDRSDR